MSWGRLTHLFLKASGERGLRFPSRGGVGWKGMDAALEPGCSLGVFWHLTWL